MQGIILLHTFVTINQIRLLFFLYITMKPVKVYSQLALLCLLMMSMGFPSVIADDDTGSNSKSVRYVKVGFFACTRQVTQAESTQKIQEPKCVNNVDKEDNTTQQNTPVKISTKVGTSVEVVSESIQHWLNR